MSAAGVPNRAAITVCVMLSSLMQALDSNITYRLATVGRTKLLLAIGSDEQMKDVADAVKELDIAAPTK